MECVKNGSTVDSTLNERKQQNKQQWKSISQQEAAVYRHSRTSDEGVGRPVDRGDRMDATTGSRLVEAGDCFCMASTGSREGKRKEIVFATLLSVEDL
eukprot:scaffold232457_cov22-Tisochrysis_lutea.AAC.6